MTLSKKLFLLGVLSLLATQINISYATTFDPWDFNVYTTQSIGSSTSAYSGSDFQGVTGSGGSDYFSGFSVNQLNTSPISGGPSLYSGGTVNYNSGSVNNGGIEAAGGVNMTNATISGSINTGGNYVGTNGTVSGNINTSGSFTGTSPTVNGNVSTGTNFNSGSSGGQISGNVKAGGTISGSATITGTQTQHATPATFAPSLSLATVTSTFQGANSFWGNLSPTLSVASDQYGLITVSNPLQAGRNILDLTLAQINAVTNSTQNYAIAFTGNVPSNAFVVIDVTGTGASSQTLNSLQLQGITGTNVLFNILGSSISNLIINGGNYVSLLAPNTNINFQSGLLTGNLVAQNLVGQGQVNTGTFSGFSADSSHFSTPVPEPSTYIILASLLLGVAGLAVYKKKNAVR